MFVFILLFIWLAGWLISKMWIKNIDRRKKYKEEGMRKIQPLIV